MVSPSKHPELFTVAGRAACQCLHVGIQAVCCASCTLLSTVASVQETYALVVCRRDHEHTWLPAQLDAIDKVLHEQLR